MGGRELFRVRNYVQDDSHSTSNRDRAASTVEILIRTGFCAVIALLFTTVLVAIGFRETPREENTPEGAAIQAQAFQISEVRRFVNSTVSGVRDFLINPNAGALETLDKELERDRNGVNENMAKLAESKADREPLKAAAQRLNAFWDTVNQARTLPPDKKTGQAYDFLRKVVYPARVLVNQNLKQLSDANAAEHDRIAAALAHRKNAQLGGIFLLLGLSLIFSLLLAFASLRYRSHLQTASVTKYNEIARARDDLEQLSGRLLKIQEEERRRLSRELHDGIGQTLTALRMEIHYSAINAGDSRERLDRARMLAEEAVQTVKDISLLLRPPLLDDLGLEPAIRWQTDQFTRRTGIPCRLRINGLQEQLPDDVKTCVFRVVQEALNNCQKHASPTQVQIQIEQRVDVLAVQVEDNGAGFVITGHNTPARQAGLGILGMRERASMLGGTLALDSAPGKGTRLILRLPVARMSAMPTRGTTVTMPPPALGAAAVDAESTKKISG